MAKQNTHGVYIDAVEKVEIPLSKSLGLKIKIEVVCCEDSLWRWGYSFTYMQGGGGGAPNVKDEGYPERDAAILAGAEWFAGHRAPVTPKDKKLFFQDIDSFVATLNVVGKKQEIRKEKAIYEQISLF